jgi:hypothetical protein
MGRDGLSAVQRKTNQDLLARLDAHPNGDALAALGEEFLTRYVPPGHNQMAYSTHCTPLDAARDVVQMAAPASDDVCIDLCAGLGPFAFTLAEYGVGVRGISAVEIAPTLYGIGSRLTPDVQWVNANAFEVAFWGPRQGAYDLVIGNPPWGLSKGRKRYGPEDGRFGSLILAGSGNGTGPSIAEAMALEVALRLLKPGGRVLFLLPPTALQGSHWERYERELGPYEADRHVQVIDVDFATAGSSAALVEVWRNERSFEVQTSAHPVLIVPAEDNVDPIARMSAILKDMETPGVKSERKTRFQPQVQRMIDNELCIEMGFSAFLSSFASVFDLIDILETETQAAIERHGLSKALDLDNCFSMIGVEPFCDFNPALYRAHVIELLERVAAEEDTRPATAAEIFLGLTVSLQHLSPEQMILAFHLFPKVAPALVAKMEREEGIDDFVADSVRALLQHYPDADPREADVLWHKYRQDLAVSGRTLPEERRLSGVFFRRLERSFAGDPGDVEAIEGMIAYLHGRELALRTALGDLVAGSEEWLRKRDELCSCVCRRRDLLKLLGQRTDDADRIIEWCSSPVPGHERIAEPEPASPVLEPDGELLVQFPLMPELAG